MSDADEPPAFYFDLASPLAYLAAERVLHVLGPRTQWVPVLARELTGAENFDAFRCATEEQIVRTEIERRAQALGLQPLRWPPAFPFDSEFAMRVATYARAIGRAVPFAQAAFRQAFAGGRDLSDRDSVLIAAAACEMHPKAVLIGADTAATRAALRASTAAAIAAGVSDVPTVRVGERLFLGERALEQAAASVAVAVL